MRLWRRPTALTSEQFTQLYEERLDAVFNYCYFRVGERQRAEDLTAEIFEQVWRDRDRYDPERASPATWLFAIARHRIVDAQRRWGRAPLVDLDGDQPDGAPLPEEQVARNERRWRLQAHIRALADEQQELVALKFGAGLTNRRIGELLGKSESAVGSALHRVMQKLRKQWEDENVRVEER
jgi:RNA polymerase sigma-70 factor, ECF subfamily